MKRPGMAGSTPAKQFAFWLSLEASRHVVEQTNEGRITYGKYFEGLVQRDLVNLKKGKAA
jgi:hypothetical protein